MCVRKGKLPLGEEAGWEIQFFTAAGLQHLPGGEGEGLRLPLEAERSRCPLRSEFLTGLSVAGTLWQRGRGGDVWEPRASQTVPTNRNGLTWPDRAALRGKRCVSSRGTAACAGSGPQLLSAAPEQVVQEPLGTGARCRSDRLSEFSPSPRGAV